MDEAVPTPRPPPSLATLSTDVVVSVLQCLDAKDTARTCRVSHAFHHLVQRHDEVLFRPHVLRQRLVSQPTPLTPQQNLAAAHTLQKALAPPAGWKGLYHVTKHLLGVPCVGFFRRVPREFRRDYKGQLMRLRPLKKMECHFDVGSDLCPTAGLGLSLEALTPRGAIRDNDSISLRLCEQRSTEGGLVLKGRMVEQKIEVDWCAHKAISGYEDALIPCFDMTLQQDEMVDGETIFIHQSLHALPVEPPSLLLPEGARQVLEGLRGFWVGTYGSHGREIIQVHFTTTAAATGGSSTIATTAAPEAPSAAAPAAAAVIMEGLKITGDANVPANEWSFRVDVSSGPVDLAEALTADTRPVYTLNTHMGPMPRLLSQEARRIHSVYRGKGQINMVPGIWAPQEVGVDVVVLHPEQNEKNGGIWVVWHDVEHTSRHCVDLTRLVVQEEEEEEENVEG